jgi:hypothetical protein
VGVVPQVKAYFERMALHVARCRWQATILDDEGYGGNDKMEPLPQPTDASEREAVMQ